MAHNITNRDGVFSVRKPMWHSLGTVLSEYPTRQEAQQIAHPWEPITEPLYRKESGINPYDGSLYETYEPITEFVVNVRSDDGGMLGVVSSTYEPVDNSELYDIAEAIESGDPGAVKYETGGSLKGGAKVWLLLALAEPIKIIGDPNGETIPYYALQNSHDGSGAFRGQALATRIVCDNTSQLADMEAHTRGTEFMFRHTKNVKDRIEQAQQALEGWRVGLREWQLFNQHLIAQEVSEEGTQFFIEKFIPAPPPHLASDRVMTNVLEAQTTWNDILNGPTCADISHTAYGLVQASVEYAQHYRKARSEESRFKRAYLDRSTIISDAVELAQEAASV